MKTNNIITRPMGDFYVEQRTKDAMFNATTLLNQWNTYSGQKKNINHYLDNATTKEFLQAIIDDEPEIRKSERPENQVIAKSKAKTLSTGGKIAGSVWMHPLMFIDFAMWLNPTFKVKVLKFVYDQMIEYRKQAGDGSIKLASAVSKIVPKSFMPVAMSKLHQAINYVVFGEHEKMMRNKVGEENKQHELVSLQQKLCELINDGFILDFDTLISYLRKKWREKHTPPQLLA